MMPLEYEVHPQPEATSRAAASFIVGKARQAIALRGRFVVAFSGGNTPQQMLRDLADDSVPWKYVHIVQVDERVAPADDTDRNLTLLQECLLSRISIPPEQVYAMPVETDSLVTAAKNYDRTLQHLAGSPPVVDLVHLGLGADGHTASLVPRDPVLHIEDRDVAITGIYQGRRRMTLTFPMINRAREILWLVTGDSKIEMLQHLLAADPTIPAGRIRQDNATILADRSAGGRD